jgi:hypothetical protein
MPITPSPGACCAGVQSWSRTPGCAPARQGAGKADLVGHERHGHAAGCQVADHRVHLADQLRVQGRGRLVEQHHLRVHGERPGDGHALLLTAGKLGRVLGHMLRQPHASKLCQGPLAGLGLGGFLDPHQTDLHVLQRREVVEEVEVLEDHADFLPVGVELGLFRGVDRLLAEEDAALLEAHQEIDAVQQRALAAARRPEDDLDVPLEQLERHPLEHLSIPVALVDIFQPENRLRASHGSRPLTGCSRTLRPAPPGRARPWSPGRSAAGR